MRTLVRSAGEQAAASRSQRWDRALRLNDFNPQLVSTRAGHAATARGSAKTMPARKVAPGKERLILVYGPTGERGRMSGPSSGGRRYLEAEVVNLG